MLSSVPQCFSAATARFLSRIVFAIGAGYRAKRVSSLHGVATAQAMVLLGSAFLFESHALSSDFERSMKPLVTRYCLDCHSGPDASGDIDFVSLTANSRDIAEDYRVWESVAKHLEAGTMPPDDSEQPNERERTQALAWYQAFVESVPARPAVLRPRRLSVMEYRNTMRSLLGFELQVAVTEAAQTESERSLAIKLLPTDVPGESGFTNATLGNPISLAAWEQYAYLADAALIELFSPHRRDALEAFTGERNGSLTQAHTMRLLRNFLPRAYRRPVSPVEFAGVRERLAGLQGEPLFLALKLELKSALVSPKFLYRGFLVEGERGARQRVDAFELAERLSFFLWADMPDQELFDAAADGSLLNQESFLKQVDRMLASHKSRRLADVFVRQWFSLDEIDVATDNPPIREAWKSQPLDFMHHLFTNDRPLIEMVDSQFAFANLYTAGIYGSDAKEVRKQKRTKGLEGEVFENMRIQLNDASERGGVLTMPGILAMNRGPILRGTWMLERILGEHLNDPPANVGQVAPNRRGENLTFRQRFEQHRTQEACSVCHNKIDPLGFVLQTFDEDGNYMLAANYRPKKQKKPTSDGVASDALDTSGRLPSGETFANIRELKEILATSQREAVIRNIVERTMAYALCRRLELFDQPTIAEITHRLNSETATWRDLIHDVTQSVPFQEMILSPANESRDRS
ncbi:MAG: DUF1592 domain-containing protein [Planctomycetota bacterium]